MTTLVGALGVLMAMVAAVRSTWSPCGRSMLSTITPIGERGRGHRFGVTAAWFVAGAAAGGVCLGGLGAGLALAVGATGLPAVAAAAIAAGAALVGAALDARLAGLRLPGHRRQVNERWLDHFRNGIYGLGFGWQIGTGLATYIMTAGVYLVVVLGALTADPVWALGIGAVFGTVRGVAVLAGRGIRSPAALSAFHRRFDALGEPSRRAAVVAQVAIGTVLLGALWPPAIAVAGAAVVVAACTDRMARHAARVGDAMCEPLASHVQEATR